MKATMSPFYQCFVFVRRCCSCPQVIPQMNRIKFTVVGDSETGKTCWLSVLKGDRFRQSHRSGSLEPFTKKFLINNAEYELEICDTVGHDNNPQDRIRTYRNTDVVIICFAENDTISFKNVVSRWYPEVKTYKPNASVVLVCTKCDIKSRRIPGDELTKVKKRCYFCHVAFCSAYSRYNIEEIFRDVIMNLCEVPSPKEPLYHKLFVRCGSKGSD